MRSARSRRSWSPTWAIRWSSSKKQRPDCALYWEIGVEEVWNLAKDPTVRQEELWRLINSRLRHQKERHPWCQTWIFRTATTVLLSQGDVAESSPTQAWWVQNNFGKMAQGWQLPKSCQILGGLRSRLFSMTILHWILQQQRKELVTRIVEWRMCSKNHWINVLISLKQNEKWKDCKMNM